jgi:porin
VRRVRYRIAATLLGAAAMAGAAHADDAPPPVELRYTVDLLSDASGGLHGGTGLLGRLDLALDKSDDAFGIPGAEARFDLMLLHGSRFSNDHAGDAQTLSNIDAPRAIRPFEAWLQIPLAAHLRAKAGYIDLNSEFDVQSVGAPFLNSSFGIAPDFSQSGRNGPSIFPVTSPGLIVVAGEDGHGTLSIGVFDALPGDPDHPHRFLPGAPGRNGALLVAEAGIPIDGTGELQIGGWRYTDRFDRLDGRGRGSSGGGYALLQGTLAGKDEGAALRAWVRVGAATGGVEPIGVYAGGGVTYGRDDALVGLAVAHARLGATALDAGYGDRRAETAIELTAYRRLNRFVAIQPDAQYIIHPSWMSSTPDALVVGLRLHLDWSPKAD